jgi:predicted nuclease with TOPRIM domain
MPTVHLSVPDRVYEQLKEKAAELGIQVTDLIKLYINQGVKYGLTHGGGYLEALKEASKRMDVLETEVKHKLNVLEGRYYELMEQITYLFKRINLLQELVESRTPVISKENIEKTF